MPGAIVSLSEAFRSVAPDHWVVVDTLQDAIAALDPVFRAHRAADEMHYTIDQDGSLIHPSWSLDPTPFVANWIGPDWAILVRTPLQSATIVRRLSDTVLWIELAVGRRTPADLKALHAMYKGVGASEIRGRISKEHGLLPFTSRSKVQRSRTLEIVGEDEQFHYVRVLVR